VHQSVGEGARSEAVPGEAALGFAEDDVGLTQDAQVVADGCLPRPGDLDQVAGAQMLAGEGLDDLQAQWVREQPELLCERKCAPMRRLESQDLVDMDAVLCIGLG
jgi:hypothetical protein